MSWTIPKTTRTMAMKVTATDVSLFFGLPILAYSEIKFGTEVLGLPHARLFGGVVLSLAYFVPGFLDVYVITAMRRGGREVGWALGLVIMSVTGGSIAHLYTLTDEQKVLASAVFGCMLAVVIWRVKTIAHTDSPATAAANLAAAQVHDLTAELARVQSDLAERDHRLTAADEQARTTATQHAQALQAATDQVGQLERDLTETEHRHEVAQVRLRAQLDAARAAARPGNVVNLRPDQDEDAPVTAPATDAELIAVLAPMVAENPGTGRPAALAAVRDAGLACGSQRVRDLLAQAKAAHQSAQAAAVAQVEQAVAVSS